MEVPPNQPEGNQPGYVPPMEGQQPPQMSAPPGAGPDPQNYANYPRYFQQGSGPIPPGPASVRFAAIGEAWELIKKDMSPYILAMLILLVSSIAINFAISFPVQLLLMRPY